MQPMEMQPVFNPNGVDDVAERQIWFGNTTNLMNLNNVRFTWANNLYSQMRENFWIPEKIDTTQDVVDYRNLTEQERRAYNATVSFLTFLDSTQTANLPCLKTRITAPEISLCFAEQISQEAMHNKSYQVLIESIVPSEFRNYVYDFWRTDKNLSDRCQFIASIYQEFVDKPTKETYFVALLADYLLEGIYFYNSFMFFYVLASRHLMPGTADMIRLINRDELSHTRFMQELIKEGFNVFPHSTEQVLDMFVQAVKQEIKWTNHIMGGDILGITEQSTREYTEYLANIRLKAIGMPHIFESKKNPYRHLEKIADTQGNGEVKANYFEAGVTSYVMSSAIPGWEDF